MLESSCLTLTNQCHFVLFAPIQVWIYWLHDIFRPLILILSNTIEQDVAQDGNLILFALQVTTVDKYQGQQNDYILLSLVRTKAVGHLRDVRRLVVAMSRARLGLYIFARVSLFQNCYELTPAFQQVIVNIIYYQ